MTPKPKTPIQQAIYESGYALTERETHIATEFFERGEKHASTLNQKAEVTNMPTDPRFDQPSTTPLTLPPKSPNLAGAQDTPSAAQELASRIAQAIYDKFDVRIHGKLNLTAIPSDLLSILQPLLAPLEQKQEQRDGKWIDKWGCCKVCDGEIPHGHAPNCDIYKLEQQVHDAESRLSKALGALEKCWGALQELAPCCNEEISLKESALSAASEVLGGAH